MYESINTFHRISQLDDGRILRLIGEMNGLQGVEKMKGWKRKGFGRSVDTIGRYGCNASRSDPLFISLLADGHGESSEMV